MNNRALTLVEIIISVTIITLISGGMLGMYVTGRQVMDRSRRRMQALSFAQEALDKLRGNYQYSSSQMSEDAGDNPHTASEIGGDIIRGEMDNLSGVLTYTVTTEPATDSYREVTVSVSWTEPTI